MPIATILRVDDSTGKTLSSWEAAPGTRVVDQQITRTLNDVLTDNGARAYIFGTNNALTLPDRPVAAKTGTTNDFYDAWTVGYTPNLLTVVWVGNTKHTPMKRGADSSATAAPIWQTFMKAATKSLPKESFQKPDPVTGLRPALAGGAIIQRVKIDKTTGMLATEFTPPSQVEDRTFFAPHDILYFIDKDDPLGDAPTNPANDPQFAGWEAGVADWLARTHATTTEMIPKASSDQYGPAFAPVLNILEPINQTTITGRFLPIRVEATAPRGVAHIHIKFGDHDLGDVQGPPWNFGVTLPSDVTDGYYDLTLTATDDLGNATTQVVTVQLQTGSGPSSQVEPPITSTTSY